MTRLEIIAALEAAREKALASGPGTTGERLRDLASAVKAAAFALARCGETLVPAPSEPERPVINPLGAYPGDPYEAAVPALLRYRDVAPDEIDEDPPEVDAERIRRGLSPAATAEQVDWAADEALKL